MSLIKTLVDNHAKRPFVLGSSFESGTFLVIDRYYGLMHTYILQQSCNSEPFCNAAGLGGSLVSVRQQRT